jgi:hypothetical protein
VAGDHAPHAPKISFSANMKPLPTRQHKWPSGLEFMNPRSMLGSLIIVPNPTSNVEILLNLFDRRKMRFLKAYPLVHLQL